MTNCKKVLNTLKAIFVIVLVLLTLYVAVASILAKVQNKQIYIFGHSFHIVVSDSMEPDLKVGDFVLSKKVDVSQVKLGDSIVFIGNWGTVTGKTVVHSVWKIENVEGEIRLFTKGINHNALPDPSYRTDIVGVSVWNSGFVGGVIRFFSNWFSWVLVAILGITFVVVKKLLKSIIDIKNTRQ